MLGTQTRVVGNLSGRPGQTCCFYDELGDRLFAFIISHSITEATSGSSEPMEYAGHCPTVRRGLKLGFHRGVCACIAFGAGVCRDRSPDFLSLSGARRAFTQSPVNFLSGSYDKPITLDPIMDR